MKINRLLPLLLALLLLTASCSSKKISLPYFQNLPQSGQLEELDYLNKIQPDDELQITVTSLDPSASAMFNLPEVNPASRALLSQTGSPRLLTYTVDSQGDITMPELGRVHAAGLTVEQLQQKITELISRTVAEPQVTVTMVNFTITVAGEVKEPKNITVNRNRYTILEALTAAGDLTAYGERSNVLLIREVDGKREYNHINLNDAALLNSPYYYLQPNDYIYVSPNEISQSNARYSQYTGFKLSVISTIVSATSVIASLVIALTVK